MAESQEALALEFAVRRIVDQRARLDNLRTRAATLLSAAALATSFLGAEALKDTRMGSAGEPIEDHGLEFWELVGVGAFVGLGVACLVVLWPRRKRWKFGVDVSKMIGEYVDGDKRVPLPVMERDLALHLSTHYRHNERPLGALFWWFQGAALLLGVSVVAWLVDLI